MSCTTVSEVVGSTQGTFEYSVSVLNAKGASGALPKTLPPLRTDASVNKLNGGNQSCRTPAVKSPSSGIRNRFAPQSGDAAAMQSSSDARPSPNAATPAGLTHVDSIAVPSGSNSVRITNFNSTPISTANDGIQYKPIFPSDVKRYERNITIDRKVPVCTFKALQVEYLDEPIVSPHGWNWEKHTHPEGAPYYYETTQRVFTDANLTEESTISRVEACVHSLQTRRKEHPNAALLIDDKTDLVVEFTDPYVCKYYLADHSRKIVVWLEDWIASKHTSVTTVDGAEKLSHFAHLIRGQYWSHWELYPTQDVSVEVYDELQTTLVFSSIDARTSRTSTSPYSPQELQDMLDLVIKIRNIKPNTDSAACITGRLLSVFEEHKYINFYGQPNARLCQTQSVHHISRPAPSALFRILCFFLFGAPGIYLVDLERVYVDELVTYPKWNEYIKDAVSEWGDYNLLATVVLTATVGLLATQSVDHTAPHRSLSQIVAYCAAIFSVGSLICGLGRIRRHRKSQRTAYEAAAYLKSVSDAWPFYRLESAAMVAALPFGLLAWSIVCFLAAVATVCFNNPDVATAVTLGTVSAVVFVLIVWSVFADSMWARLARGSQHFAERVKQGLMDGWKACGRVRRGERRSSSSSVVCDV